MANQEHLHILNQGVDVWNGWRRVHPNSRPDLTNADLSDIQLVLSDGGDVIEIDLSRADLSGAVLWGADLLAANLSNANLSKANLTRSQFISTDLKEANLQEAILNLAIFDGTQFKETNFSQATLGSTIFVDVDFSSALGLETVIHSGPSSIGIDTIYRSQGHIPEIFLRGTGVPEPFITNMRALVDAMSPIEFYSCFISYYHENEDFAKRLYADLLAQGVRCWFAPEDMKIGDKIRPRIDESIRLYDKVLLVLSEHSVARTWVEHEVETALAKERRSKQAVLFPVRLDEAILEREHTGWPALVQNERHVGDFTRWKEHDSYQQAFERLLSDLKAGA